MTRFPRPAALSMHLAVLAGLAGCETNGWLIDPQRTGYFETTPTAIPILSRIDVIEQASDATIEFSQPTAEDLVPVQLEYRLASGDIVKVSIPQLVSAEQTDISTRVVDQAGKITLPIIGQVQAGGRTIPELEGDIKDRLKGIITNPKAFVSVEEGRAYQFRVLGSVEQPGLFGLNKPDLRVLDALALARGAAPTTTRILITRAKAQESKQDAVGSTAAPATAAPTGAGEAPVRPAGPQTPAGGTAPPSGGDIDALINELPNASEPPKQVPPAAATPSTEPKPADQPPPVAEPAKPAEPANLEPAKPARLGMLASTRPADPPIDIDTLEAPKAADAPVAAQVSAEEGDRFTFDSATQSWVRVGRAQASAPAPSAETPSQDAGIKSVETAKAGLKNTAKRAVTSRVIEIDYNALVRGASNLNVIIHPDDMIYCDQGDVGVVYIDGLIARPGVYNLPTSGKLTLSRLVAAAGGLGELAIPQRVDLVRRIGADKEACIRVNLAAIRNRAEPDILLRPDDHINIGTNFWATPLAVIRNGFRMTYGFGFLVDRNWGNDIFGPPPTNVLGQ